MEFLDPFIPERLAGTVIAVQGSEATVSLPWAGMAPVSLFGQPVLRGEVGEFLLFACGPFAIFGRLVTLEAPRTKRPEASTTPGAQVATEVSGTVQLLGTLRLNGKFARGLERHPRVGDLAYAADADAIRAVLSSGVDADGARLPLGVLRGGQDVEIDVPAEVLFGRHLAIVGSTGGGKSWTLQTLMEQSAKEGVRILLLDATGEFAPLDNLADHVSVATSPPAIGSQASLPHRQLSESDRRALLRPSAGAQLPKLRSAIRSLRLANALGEGHSLIQDGLLYKANRPRKPYSDACFEHAAVLDDPQAPFNLRKLSQQVPLECVYENDQREGTSFGNWAMNELSYCNTMIARILDLTSTAEVMDILDPHDASPSESVLDLVDQWLDSEPSKNILRISLADLTFEHNMREIVVNTIGRHLLSKARKGAFNPRPLVVAIDEAHQFFGQGVADEFVAASFDSFDLVAKEGRKYGLVICMATQRPGDLPAAVLSQAGMLLVHRLTERRDRERVEQAASELTLAATRLLPALVPGEALIVGSEFAVPVPVRMHRPQRPPKSDGPTFSRTHH
ncbi:DNA helicase HerA-like ATPase [Nocardioides salarius]|uniref:DNA helicase HerA-like ATPase n=1 Tax=Nocardioides salarius TaxID=374513 RepID=A0ABS2MDU2_9ACTN|nr:ATP-binding protein [Nocardioides salarius]MBM7509330.1 DNA helicase HerA-like ATPase [Nocardioides salarius]